VPKVRDSKFLLRFGRNLKKARNKRGITQEELAYKSGLALSQIARIETGRINTTASTIALILKTLNASSNELFD
jgi:transcriptional regulator with XRE-family HTH domain